jgi:hypothetical protein
LALLADEQQLSGEQHWRKVVEKTFGVYGTRAL